MAKCAVNYKEVIKRTRKVVNNLIKDKPRVEQIQAIKVMHVKLSALPTQDAAIAFRKVVEATQPEAISFNAYQEKMDISNVPQWVADISPEDFINELDLIEQQQASGQEAEEAGQTATNDFEKTKQAEIRVGEAGIDGFTPMFFAAVNTNVNNDAIMNARKAVAKALTFDGFENWIVPRYSKYDQNNDWQKRMLLQFYRANRPINKISKNEKMQLIWTNLNPFIDDIKEAIVHRAHKAFQPKRATSLKTGTKEPDFLAASFLDKSTAKIFGTPIGDLTMTISVNDMQNVTKWDGSETGYFTQDANLEVTPKLLNKWNKFLATEMSKKGNKGQALFVPSVITGVNSGDPGTVMITVIHPKIRNMLIPPSTVRELAAGMSKNERAFLERNNYNLFRALRVADKTMHQVTTPQERKRTVKGVKTAAREEDLRKIAAHIAYGNYVQYFSDELAAGNIEEADFESFLLNAKKENVPAENGSLMIPFHTYLAGIIAKHEWWKAARYNKYIFNDDARAHFNRLRLTNTKGLVLEGMGETSHLAIDPSRVEVWVTGRTAEREGVSEYKVEHLREIPGLKGTININDGMTLASTEILRTTGERSGRNPISKYELPVKELKSAFSHRSEDGIDYIEIKHSEQEAVPDVEIRHKRTGDVIATIVYEMDEVRIFDANNEIVDFLHDTDTPKSMIGKFNFKGKSHTSFTLPEESRRIIKLPGTVAHTTAPMFRQYMPTMFTDRLNKQNQSDMDQYNKLLEDTMLGMVDKHMDALTEVMTDPDQLRRLIATMWAQQMDSGDALKDMIALTEGAGIHHPTNMSQLRPMLSNMMLKKGALQARTYEDKIYNKLQEDFAGSDGVLKTDYSGKIKEPDKYAIVSSGLASIFRLAERKYKDFKGAALMHDMGWSDFSHEDKIEAINQSIRDEGFKLYINIFRTPLSHHAGMVIREIQEFEAMQGTALKTHPNDVFGTMIGDQDIDIGNIILVSDDFATRAKKYQDTTYFKSQKQVTAYLDQFEHDDSSSLADYNGSIKEMSSQIGGGSIGQMANMKTMSALFSIKFGEITLTNGITVKAKSPSEMTTMDYAPLSKVDKEGNPLRKEAILAFNPSFASIVEADNGNWYLRTTVEHEMLLIINAATDHVKHGLLTKWGYNGQSWITNRQFKSDKPLEKENIDALVRLKGMFNLSPLFNGKSRSGKQLKIDQIFYLMRETYNYNIADPETQLSMIQKEVNIDSKETVAGKEEKDQIGIQAIENKGKITSLEKMIMRPIEKMIETYDGIENVPPFPGFYSKEDYEVMHYLATKKISEEINSDPTSFEINSPELITEGSKFISRWGNKYYDLFYKRKSLDGEYTTAATLARNRFDEEVNAWVQQGVQALDDLAKKHGPGIKAWATLKFLQGIGQISGTKYISRKNIQHLPDPAILDKNVTTKYMDYWEDVELNFEDYKGLNLKKEAKRTRLSTLNLLKEKDC